MTTYRDAAGWWHSPCHCGRMMRLGAMLCQLCQHESFLAIAARLARDSALGRDRFKMNR